MPLLDVVRPARKVVPDPIVTTKVAREVQEAFDRLEEKTYNCTRTELLRVLVLDCFRFQQRLVVLVQKCSFLNRIGY